MLTGNVDQYCWLLHRCTVNSDYLYISRDVCRTNHVFTIVYFGEWYNKDTCRQALMPGPAWLAWMQYNKNVFTICQCTQQVCGYVIIKDHIFLRPAEFWAEPWKLVVLWRKCAKLWSLGSSVEAVQFLEIVFKTNVFIWQFISSNSPKKQLISSSLVMLHCSFIIK